MKPAYEFATFTLIRTDNPTECKLLKPDNEVDNIPMSFLDCLNMLPQSLNNSGWEPYSISRLDANSMTFFTKRLTLYTL